MIHSNNKAKEEKGQYADELVGVVQKVARDKDILRAFLQDLLSPAEYQELGVRWQIVKQLAAGQSHRDVAKNLHTGIVTVSRGSRTLANPKGGFRQVLQIVSKTK